MEPASAHPQRRPEAGIYSSLPNTWGKVLKNLMRTSPFRAHLTALSMVGEDMPQLANRVDLDPKVRDVHGLPVPRVTYSAHRHEIAASLAYGPKLQAVCAAGGTSLHNAAADDRKGEAENVVTAEFDKMNTNIGGYLPGFDDTKNA